MAARGYIIRNQHLTRQEVVDAEAAGRLWITPLSYASRTLAFVTGATQAEHDAFAALPGVTRINRDAITRRADADAIRDWINQSRGLPAGDTTLHLARVVAEYLTEPE